MEKFATKFIGKNVEYIVLDYLLQSDMHGYALIQRILKDHSVYLGPSTVYPALCRLEEKGLIKSGWNLSNPRVRKIYAITSQGKVEYRKEQAIIHQILSTQNTLAKR